MIDNELSTFDAFYDSFNNGYNLTPGGRDEALVLLPNKKEEVKQLWERGYGQKDIVETTKLNVETVRNYLLKSGISLEDIRNRQREKLSSIKSIPICQYDLNGNFVRRFNSATEAEQLTGINRKNISSVCNGKRKTAGGYIWRKEEIKNDY